MVIAPDDIEHPADRDPETEPPEGEETETPEGEEFEPPVDPNDPAVWQTKLEDLTDESAARADVPVRTGRFIVETTKWGAIQRPDYVNVLYQVGSATPLRVVSSVAATIISMPKDALFVIGVNTTTQQIGINGVQETNVANTLTSYLIQGIFYIHEKAFGWVKGQFF
jgi:hypothetical protein